MLKEVRQFQNSETRLLKILGSKCFSGKEPISLLDHWRLSLKKIDFSDKLAHPCDNGCQYSKDVGMWPHHSCANGCMYEMGIAGPPAITDEKLYENKEETKMTCVKCKGRGYIITDIISGNSNPCECQKTTDELMKYDEVKVDVEDVVVVPSVGMLMEITVDGNNSNSCHHYLKGTTVKVTAVNEAKSSKLSIKGITYVLKVTGLGTTQTIYYPTECRMIF